MQLLMKFSQFEIIVSKISNHNFLKLNELKAICFSFEFSKFKYGVCTFSIIFFKIEIRNMITKSVFFPFQRAVDPLYFCTLKSKI